METSAEIVRKVRESKQFKALLHSTSQANNPLATKQRIVETLAPFFDNQSNLGRFAVEALIPEVSALAELGKSATYYQYFLAVLQTYKDAKRTDSESFYEALGFWYRPCEQALVKYWSVYHLEIEKKNLPLDEYVHESFRNIGDIIEGLSQPFLGALLHIVRIRDRTVVDANQLAAFDLGTAIGKLIEECGFPELFLIPPWNIKLNQCRNIAFHHSAQVKGAEIVCAYGKPPNTKSFSTTRQDIYLAAQNIFNVFRAIKLAYSLTVVDNITDLRFPDSEPPFLRKEAHLVNLVLQFASQGFDVVSFSDSEELSRVRVRDLTKRDDKVRAAHSSQFLFSLWQSTQSRKVVIEYENTEGLLMYRFALDSGTCEKISQGEEDPTSIQAEKMTINELI